MYLKVGNLNSVGFRRELLTYKSFTASCLRARLYPQWTHLWRFWLPDSNGKSTWSNCQSTSFRTPGKFLSHWPRVCLSLIPCPGEPQPVRQVPSSVFNSQKKKQKILRLVFNWRHECAFQPLKWIWKLNRILFSRHQVIPHDDFDTNLSKMNLTLNASAYADFFLCW